MVYEPESGQLLTGSFLDYGLPRADDIPALEIEFAPSDCTTNAFAAKGVGESGTVGAPPAVMNALLDALAPLGIRNFDMPATPERVWRVISSAKES